MNRRILFLNVMLLGLAAWLSWELRAKWIELHTHENTVLMLSPQARKWQYPPSPPLFKPGSATDYNTVAQLNLFAKDRNPNVTVDPPPPPPAPPPPPVMPPLPAYYGIMSFGDPVVLLRLPKESQKNYHAGDQVGPFKLVSFDREKIVFDWDGKVVERKPSDLVEKEAIQEVASAKSGPLLPGQAQQGGLGQVKAISATPEVKVDPKLGKDNGGGVRQCVQGDASPPGTILDGYKKVVTTNMFGETCMWQVVNP